MRQLETPRLILRPFREEDAADVFDYARDPRVGPWAGWPVHKSVEESREIIKTVFTKPWDLAIVDRESGRVIGSGGLTDRHRDILPGANDEIGYMVIHQIRLRNIRVPEELSVIGFDGIEPPLGMPRLRSARMPAEDMGAAAIRALSDRSCHPAMPVRQILLDCPLVPGETIKACQ